MPTFELLQPSDISPPIGQELKFLYYLNDNMHKFMQNESLGPRALC
jgi:hypothetical protein